MYKTTTDLLNASIQLKEAAEHVTNREQHAAWWDSKTEVYIEIYNALESGAFTGEAHDELKQAQYIISEAEMFAAAYALNEKGTSGEEEPERLPLSTWENIFRNLSEMEEEDYYDGVIEWVEVTWLEGEPGSGGEWVLCYGTELFEDGFTSEEEAQQRLTELERIFPQYIN
ncbi:hypothetical protein CPT_Moonbeam225 [Bacillus phage Moonbeam]|uniref:Uncharacterized protein n=1 Tax=Bacillus phage Moonbeam TaxID=1540091 RepID=A0A0A0RVC7_9CAUD|nr:hypothetical protein CPT_Moonbeam225 [Bacillus phage Moonbeam]AIW03623.1 hypothetical protein CPT_Moonbeam225 [Bacillus phage Moonbeam]